MTKINFLSEELINKIAAGEVIERPASVIKELVENSLDAKANQITVEIEDYGQKLIRIIDNGEGMEEEDARKAILPHTTSKIKDENDLFNINTLGFRGEALASIAAVSRLSLRTKTKNKLEGFNLIVENGKILKEEICASETGTTIEIHNLFFNTPARKKFLKSDSVELKHMVEVITRYALIYNLVSFRLTHNGQELFNSPIMPDWKQKIASLYGTDLAKNLLYVNYKEEFIQVEGYISKPYQARNDKSQQAIFVNKRWIRNEEISRAIYDAYHSLLFVNKHPIFILNLTLNPHKIDVNVHPAKTEIKIEQKELVYQVVLSAVRETLRQNNLIPEMGLKEEQQLVFGNAVNEIKKKDSEFKYNFEPSYQTSLSAEDSLSIKEDVAEYNHNAESIIPEISNQYETRNNPDNSLPPIKLLGQVHKTFFIAETPGGALFIDQHVVQERVLYEQFMEQLMNNRVDTQKLLKGEVMEFNIIESMEVKEHRELLEKLGFNLEEFGENTYLLKTVPILFGRLQPKEMFYEVLSNLKENKNRLEEIQEAIITRMACRASVKAGDTLTNQEMQKLLDQLSKVKFPYTCPHGRAVLIKIPVDELEKKFRRK